MPVERAVPDLAIRVIARISGANDVPAQGCPINLHLFRTETHRWSVSVRPTLAKHAAVSRGVLTAFLISLGTRENAAMDVTTSAAEVHVSLLGGFFVAVNGQPVPDRWRLRKAQTLVKLLALAPGHRLHREVVVDRWWRTPSPMWSPTTCIRSCTRSDA